MGGSVRGGDLGDVGFLVGVLGDLGLVDSTALVATFSSDAIVDATSPGVALEVMG